MRLSIEDGVWGSAGAPDILAVLQSAAGEIWKNCPRTGLDPIHVRHRSDHPQIDWARAADGRIVIGLNTKDLFWAQYAYQFAHEFCHALCEQSGPPDAAWRVEGKPNHWLEESLCETASLFSLRAMGRSWETAPPYPNWKSFAPALTSYARERMEDPRHQLPPGLTFAQWFAAEQGSLRENSTQREKNNIIAARLLPLFEAEPRGWEAVTYFDRGPRDKALPLDRFLVLWRERSPAELQPFITKVGAVFGIVF